MAKILVVDDEAHILKLVQVNLERAGDEVVTVNDPHVAVVTARETQPDLILLDYMMPHLNGGEIHGALQQDPSTQHIPVVFLGARAADASVFASQDAEIARIGRPCIRKPFNPRQLVELVHRVLAEVVAGPD